MALGGRIQRSQGVVGVPKAGTNWCLSENLLPAAISVDINLDNAM